MSSSFTIYRIVSILFNMKKIVIIGTCGSGKTTLGRQLAKRLNIPVTDLDDLYWLPHWKFRPEEECSALIEKTVSQEEWIICGNQSKYRALIWPKADTIIWLDFPLHILFWRLLSRGIRQMISGEMICNGNQQTLYRLLWILHWLFRRYWRNKKRYGTLSQTTPHVHWIHLTNGSAIQSFIKSLNS